MGKARPWEHSSRLNAEAEMSLSCRASQRATLTKVGKCSLDKRLRV